MKRLLSLLLFAAPCLAQTTVTIPNTVLHPGVERPGVDPSYLTNYGNQQYLKSLFYADGGDLPGYYMQTTFTCSSPAAGVSQWFYSGNESAGFPANFFNGASYIAVNAATTAKLGTGTITASTTSQAGTGPTFSLSNPMTAACTPGNPDTMIMKLTAANQLMTPTQLFSETGASLPGSATFDYADLPTGAINQQQSLVLQPSTTLLMATDQVLSNQSNPNPALQTVQTAYINLNGTYNWSFYAKCGSASGTVPLVVNGYRGNSAGSPFFSTSPTLNCNPASGAGWTQYSGSFTASETGLQNSNFDWSFACGSGGNCKLSQMEVVEQTQLPGGNPTVFRDAVIRKLQALKPGVIRFMSPGDWCSDVADQIQPMQAIRWCNVNTFTPYVFKPALGYNEELHICSFIGSDCYISVGMFNQPADWTTLITWLSTNTNYLALVAGGHKLLLAHGNEAFNSGAGGYLGNGDGTVYGSFVGPNFAAARAASGYDSTHMLLVANSWWATNQSYGNFGWVHNMLASASATSNGCPDGVEIAPYNAPSYLGTDAGTTSGEPWTSLLTNVVNWDSVTSPPGSPLSVYLSTQYVNSTQTSCTSPRPFTMVYEVGDGLVSGIGGLSQSRTNQITAGVGQALALTMHHHLMRRDSALLGPLGTFAFGEPYTGFTCGYNGASNVTTTTNGAGSGLKINTTASNGVITGGSLTATLGSGYTTGDLVFPVQSGGVTANFTVTASGGTPTAISLNSGGPSCASPLVTAAWGITRLTPCGPAQIAAGTCTDPDRPQSILMQIENQALGNNSNMIATSQSGPTYSYPGGQVQAGQTLVFANSAVPEIEGIAYCDVVSPTQCGNNRTVMLYNLDLVNPQSVTLAGAGAPGSSSVTQWLYPNSGESVESNNEAVYLDPSTNSLAQDTLPGSTSTTGNSYTVPAGSAYILTYTLGGTPVAAMPTFSPVAGTYGPTQTVTISTTSGGAILCYNTTGSPATNGTTGCTTGTLYTGPVAVSISETLFAVAGGTGFLDSPVGSAAYVINGAAHAPTFSPVAGTYSGTQTVTISSTSGGAILCYNTTGSPATNGSTGCTVGTHYTGPVTVSSSETLFAVAGGTGFVDSTVASAAYVINGTAATPTFSPVAGTYAGTQTVTISTTSGTVICWNTTGSPATNGTTGCTTGTLYTGTVTVATSETLFAVAGGTGLSDSSVGSAAYTITVSPTTGVTVSGTKLNGVKVQ